jgi:hypothetical protein
MTAARPSGPLDKVPGRFEVAKRGEPERRAPAAAFDLGDHVLGSLFISSAHQHVSAMGGKGKGRSPAKTARRARDQSCLPIRCVVALPSPADWVARLTMTDPDWVVKLRIC